MNKILDFLKANWQDILKPVTVLLTICIIISLALSLTNRITEAKIAELEKQTQEETMSLLVDADEFDEQILGDSEEKFEYYVASKAKETVAYIFITSAKGYGGEVSVMTAVNTDGTVKEVAILDVSNETPGLGQNAKNESFFSQFKDKNSDVILVKNGADSKNNEINAVTGATITSKAVTSAVNEALDRYEMIASLSSTDTPEAGEETAEITDEEVEAVEEQ